MTTVIDLDEPPPEEPPKLKKPTKAEKRAAIRLQTEERRKQHHRDHLQRELRQSEMNWRILKQKFVDMIVRMKLPEMKDDALTVWHSFDRTIDMKNCIISRLLDFLDETDEQYRTNQLSHIEMIDGLIVFYNGQLDKFRENYMIKLTETKNEDSGLKISLETRNGIQTGQLEAIMFAMEKTFQNHMTNFKSDSIAKIEDDVNKYQELAHNLRVELERQMEAHWNQLKEVLANYIRSTSEMKTQFKVLRSADMCMAQELYLQIVRTHKLYESIKSFKEELAEVRDIKAEAISDLMNEKQYYLDRLYTLRIQLKNERKHDDNQLKTLTVESNAVIKWLQNLADKGERILRVAAVCRKMETQKEKVLPYPYLPITSSLKEQEKEEKSSEILIKIHQDFQDMDLFWHRMANVDIKRTEMVQCYDLMLLENHYLYQSLRRYIDGLPPNPPPPNIKKITMNDISDKHVKKF